MHFKMALDPNRTFPQSLYPSSRWITAALMALSIASCHSQKSGDGPISITPVKPLTAEDGQDVDWSFKATRNGRVIKITNLSAGYLPVGVKFDDKNFRFAGKVINRMTRNGMIKVTAFDEEACRREEESTKKLILKNAIESKSNEVTIPISECKASASNREGLARQHTAEGYFSWNMIDGPDHMVESDYPAVLKSITQKQTPTTHPVTARHFVVIIPEKEAPHTGDVILGECAPLPFGRCGQNPKCLWGERVCVSHDVTGRTPHSGVKR